MMVYVCVCVLCMNTHMCVDGCLYICGGQRRVSVLLYLSQLYSFEVGSLRQSGAHGFWLGCQPVRPQDPSLFTWLRAGVVGLTCEPQDLDLQSS